MSIADEVHEAEMRKLRATEPWYYEGLLVVAFVFGLIGIGQFAIVAIMALVLAVQGNLGAAMAVPVGIYSIVVLFATAMVVTPMYLAVDIARNIRQTRHQIDRGIALAERLAASGGK